MGDGVSSCYVEQKKVSLGIKQLQEDPWNKVTKNYSKDDEKSGVVKKITDFGAFIELEPGIDGLLHISELAKTKINNLKDIIKVGERINVVIIDIDQKVRRIGLSIKILENNRMA